MLEQVKSITEVKESEAVVNCWDAFEVSAQSTRQVKEASSSETRCIVEGKCCSRKSQMTDSRERDPYLVPFGDTQQQPALKHRRRLWEHHRKRGRRKTAEQQKRFPVSCWTPHRKRGKWKTRFNPLDIQQKKGAHLHSRCQWKSGNRAGGKACPPDDAAMYVKLRTFEYIF